MYDVIVVGGGPGGAVAAHKCAQQGLKTLLIERKKLPRDKVCTGMVMGPWAKDIIQEEFGPIPGEVLIDPYTLTGHQIHVPGVPPSILECDTPLTWRRDLDFWMIQRAQEKGVEVWDRAKAMGLEESAGSCRIKITRDKRTQEIQSTFVIGADGASSVVRKSLFPELKVQYVVPTRECYEGALDLERDYIHWFFPKSRYRPRFNFNHKGDCFLIEGSGIKELRNEITQALNQHGFSDKNPLLWRDGCLIPRLHEVLISGAFSPAKGNVLLVGDAAGFILPITFEGIGTALKSGILAAASIQRSDKEGAAPAGPYLQEIQSIRNIIKRLYTWNEKLDQAAAKGRSELSQALKAAYEDTLIV